VNTHYGIYFNRVDASGTPASPVPTLVSDRRFDSSIPRMTFNGQLYSLVWQNQGGGASRLSMTWLDVEGHLSKQVVDVSDAPVDAKYPIIMWNGTEFGVLWQERSATEPYRVMFARVACQN